jgi:hypothetical protein
LSAVCDHRGKVALEPNERLRGESRGWARGETRIERTPYILGCRTVRDVLLLLGGVTDRARNQIQRRVRTRGAVLVRWVDVSDTEIAVAVELVC